MAGYQIKKMNWTRTMSAYESVTAWRTKTRAYQAKYEASRQETTSALETAWNDVGFSGGEIAARKASARIEAEIKARQEQRARELAADDNLINPPKQSVFDRSSTTTLDGGSKIDMASNTLTMSDGTIVDLKTGLKKINITV